MKTFSARARPAGRRVAARAAPVAPKVEQRLAAAALAAVMATGCVADVAQAGEFDVRTLTCPPCSASATMALTCGWCPSSVALFWRAAGACCYLGQHAHRRATRSGRSTRGLNHAQHWPMQAHQEAEVNVLIVFCGGMRSCTAAAALWQSRIVPGRCPHMAVARAEPPSLATAVGRQVAQCRIFRYLILFMRAIQCFLNAYR